MTAKNRMTAEREAELRYSPFDAVLELFAQLDHERVARVIAENAWADERDEERKAYMDLMAERNQLHAERDEARAERDKALDERDAAEASRETQWQRAEKAERTLRENVLGE